MGRERDGDMGGGLLIYIGGKGSNEREREREGEKR